MYSEMNISAPSSVFNVQTGSPDKEIEDSLTLFGFEYFLI